MRQTKSASNAAEERLDVTAGLVRNLAIVKQGLNVKPPDNGKAAILAVVNRLKMLQLDSVNVVDRSHYLVVLSRLGPYARRDLDELVYPDKRIFEQWCHANCILPMEAFPMHEPEILDRRNRPMRYGRLRGLGESPEDALKEVLQRIQRDGPLMSKDFGDTRPVKAGWWNRKPARVALDVLWNQGFLAIRNRTNFQCIYDCLDRVIPPEMLGHGHVLEDYRRGAVIDGLDALGIGTLGDITDYYRQKLPETRDMIKQLLAEGVLRNVSVDGWPEPAYALTKDADMIAQLRKTPPAFERTTLLSPFDNLIWTRDRTERLFGLHFRVEMYTPKQQRAYGYYSMPILHGNRIIGRADPKTDRKTRTLVVNSVHLEDGVELSKVAESVAGALDELKTFNECKHISITRAQPQIRAAVEARERAGK